MTPELNKNKTFGNFSNIPISDKKGIFSKIKINSFLY